MFVQQPKAVVIGDCHFYNAYPSFDYLESQFDTIREIVVYEKPTHVVFLGDIFHFRKPDPETIVRVVRFFVELSYLDGRRNLIFIRGNHDTAAKSDSNPLCVLSILDGSVFTGNSEVVTTASKIPFSDKIDFHLIAHYDDEHKIREFLDQIPEKTKDHKTPIVFGHFGFKGCINPNGDEDSPLGLDVFKYKTFLGHIHKAQDEGNVHVVGTPYSTTFSESDNNHRYAVIEANGNHYFRKINFGVRYVQFPLNSLEANKKFICDGNYDTILRVYLDQILDNNSVDLRKKIMAEYDVCYVDIKYLPMADEGQEQSSYRPKSMVFELTDDLIQNYISECKSEIPVQYLLDGLKLLKEQDDLKKISG